MAHPFRYFRKHQKAFLAVAAVVAMFVFVIGDQITAIIGQGGGGRDPSTVVASWKGGKMSLMELDVLTQRRYFLSQFLDRLRMTGAQRLIEQGGTPVMPSVPDFVLPENSTPRDIQVGVVTTRILADQAKKAGITISDNVINHFLKETSFRRVSDDEILMLLQGLRGGDSRGLEDQLFTGLRELLLGNTYFGSFNADIRNVMPEQRWEDWKRINDRISLEVAAVPVSDFAKQVPDPSDAELLAFYEEYKDNVARIPYMVLGTQLPSADPGFKVPRKVKLNYLLGDVNAWSEKYRDSITEEEIADYYERNKRTQFVKTDGSTPAFDEGLFDTDSTEDPAGEPASAGGETSDNAEEKETQAAPAEDESGSTSRVKKFQLAAFQENETEEAAEVEAGEEADAEEAAELAIEAMEGEPASAGGESDVEDESDNKEGDKTQYVPLDEVRDTIRNKLATDKAVVELKKVVDRIYGELDSEYNPYGLAVVTARSEKQEIPAPPETLTNLKERAKEAGITSEETVLVTQRELADTYVGKAVDAQTQSELVLQAAFDDLQLYEPMLAKDLDANYYLVTKVEDVPEKVPAFDEIKSEVLQAWKIREAAKLALTRAEELAAAAQKAGDTLGTFFIGKPYEVLTTDLFSWLTFGSTPAEMERGPRLGDAPPLTAVGPDFMTKAFELKADEVAALLNFDQTNAYIFRVDRRESTPEELQALFLKEANTWYGGRVMMMARWQNQQRRLLEELTNRVGLDLEKLEEFLRPNAEEE
ncbi:MAG: hypothetical protein SH868_14465 [Bythopirellula sp.]|nr:hypothetical protein [Bythopirellula sp.]